MDSKNFVYQRIPHREPFLWIDSVTEISPNRLLAKKTISPDLDIFKGHYPQYPIMPGVILCEAVFQAGAILLAEILSKGDKEDQPETGEGSFPVLTRIQNAKFKREVYPGDIIDIEVSLSERVSNAWFLKGRVLVKGKVAVKVDYACTVSKAPNT